MLSFRFRISFFASFLLFFPPALSFSSESSPLPIMPVSEIEPGMVGVGKTVFLGDKIEDFNVKIIGTLKNFLPKQDIILAELQGDRLQYTGVIGGMSGSPIYIDGRLIGALAYGWQFSKDPICGITPIEKMLEIEANSTASGAAAPQGGAAAGPPTGAAHLYDPFNAPVNPLLDGTLDNSGPGAGSFTAGGASLTRLQVPLIFSGCHPEVVDRFGKIFAPFGLVPLMGGNTAGNDTRPDQNPALEAGSALSAQLIRGDVSLAATGTLTFRHGDRVLAFGHPFLNFGPVDFPMTAAEIVTVLPNVASSFKISNSTSFAGSIKTDHTNGVFGIVGSQPRMIPLDITLKLPGQKEEKFHYEMIRHKMLTPVLGAISLVNSLFPAGDALSEQTLRVRGKIDIEGTEPIMIANMYAGSTAQVQLTQTLQTALQYLYSNYYGPAEIKTMELEVDAAEGFPRALVSEIYLDRKTVYPGDSLKIEVVLDPYDRPRFKEQFSVEMPPVDTDEKLFVMVGAADIITRTEFQLSPNRFRYTSLEHLVRLINSTKKNNCLYFKVFRLEKGLMLGGREMTGLPPSVWSLLQSDKSAGATLPLNDLTLAEIEIPTDYLVNGFKLIQIDLKPRP